MDTFLQQIINGLVLGSIYALVALGYTMVYGILGLINFAHGDIVMVGALVGVTVMHLLAGSGLPPAVIWGKQYLSVPQIVTPSAIDFGGAQLTDVQAWIFFLACGVMAALLWFIKSSRVGRAMRATEQNPDIAGLMGIDTNRIIAFTFLLGSAIGAIAGVMVVLYYGLGHYFMGFMLGLKAFTAAVLGGIGNIAGAMLGGLLLGLIESLASGYIGDLTGGLLGSNYRDIFAFLVLIAVLVLKPSGLMGRHVGERA